MEPDEFATRILQVPEKLAAFSEDPGTQILLLLPLCSYDVQTVPTDAPLGEAENRVMAATAALCRRAALVMVCRVAAQWQASNWDEVMQMKERISGLLNDEITLAIDQQDPDTADALKRLRTQVLQILTNAAGDLPHLRTITRPSALPALLIAQQLYADGSRAEALVQRRDPVHPAFMPMTLEVLGS